MVIVVSMVIVIAYRFVCGRKWLDISCVLEPSWLKYGECITCSAIHQSRRIGYAVVRRSQEMNSLLDS